MTRTTSTNRCRTTSRSWSSWRKSSHANRIRAANCADSGWSRAAQWRKLKRAKARKRMSASKACFMHPPKTMTITGAKTLNNTSGLIKRLKAVETAWNWSVVGLTARCHINRMITIAVRGTKRSVWLLRPCRTSSETTWRSNCSGNCSGSKWRRHLSTSRTQISWR